MRAYTFIRKDLPIQHQIVQACHSALQAGAEFLDPQDIPYLICLEANNTEHLNSISNFLGSIDIKHHKFYEPDNNIGYSSITTEPLDKAKAKLLSNFKLWRHHG